MGLYKGGFPFLRRQAPLKGGPGRRLRTKLMMILLPSLVLILMVAGYVSYRVSYDFIDIALGRTVRVQTKAVAHEVGALLDRCRQDLLYVARDAGNPEALRDFLARKVLDGGAAYRELGYLSPDSGGHALFVAHEGAVVRVPDGKLDSVSPSPFLIFNDAKGLAPGEVRLTPVVLVEHPFPTPDNAGLRLSSHLVRLVTPCDPDGDGRPGYLVLGLDVTRVRDILSLYNSPQSPLWAYPRSDEVRFTYVFDPDGWMLFQAEPMDQDSPPLSTYLARSGMDGTLGRPELDGAFRPGASNTEYWRMVTAIRQGRSDLLRVSDEGKRGSDVKQYFLSYAPVMFGSAPDKDPEVVWGVAFVDRSKLAVAAGYRHLDALFVITLAASALVAAIITLASLLVTRPVNRLSEMVGNFRTTGRIRRIDLRPAGYETGKLTGAINDMIDIISQQHAELSAREQSLRRYTMQERADIERELPAAGSPGLELIPRIIGHGPKIVQLKSDILKASHAGVDVLIVGETGTGKQLAAEAVHAHSPRAGRPFVCINCGALDENLLLDTLFGHVRGAFTDSKTDRKGAFVEADGGTLFLDEIQSASPKVQQALLRAIAERRIKPLGSDKEIAVDVRLIAATNADLPGLIARGNFREDLYFRLKVVTVQTPPLREHLESIPALTLHYLRQAEQMVGKHGLGLSRGAMEKLRGYHWPGNIRELVHAITRAVVMAEEDLIQAGDIRLEQECHLPVDDGQGADEERELSYLVPRDEDAGGGERAAVERPGRRDAEATADEPPAAPPQPPARASDPASRLNDRQRKAYPEILRRGEVTRQGYQDIVGNGQSARTAVYDLQDMVKKGLLVKTGRGPATKYLVA